MTLTWRTAHLASDEELVAGLRRVATGPARDESNDTRLLTGQLFNQAMRRSLRVLPELARALLAEPRPGGDAIGLCVWCLDRADALRLLRPLLDDADRRTGAAWALGCLRDTGSADRLLAMLDETAPGSRERGHVLTALARLDTPDVRLELARRAAEPDDRDLFHLARALRLLTGHAPLTPPPKPGQSPRNASLTHTRAYWRTADPMTRPSPHVTWGSGTDTEADIEVEHGADVFALDDAQPTRAQAWPLWFVAWTTGHEEIYTVGSNCDTCEIFLRRTGWAPAQAVAHAQTIREAVADVGTLTPGLLDALEPVLSTCATGRYSLRLRDAHLTATTDPRETWYCVRLEGHAEDPDDPDGYGSFGEEDPDLVLYTGRRADGSLGSFTVAPTQPASALDEAQVGRYVRAIDAGARPAVLLAAHAAARHVLSADDRDDRSVTAFVVDGHHKLAAYARLGVPARVLLLCDLEPRLNPGVADVPALRALFDEVLGEVCAAPVRP